MCYLRGRPGCPLRRWEKTRVCLWIGTEATIRVFNGRWFSSSLCHKINTPSSERSNDLNNMSHFRIFLWVKHLNIFSSELGGGWWWLNTTTWDRSVGFGTSTQPRIPPVLAVYANVPRPCEGNLFISFDPNGWNLKGYKQCRRQPALKILGVSISNFGLI